MKLKRNYNKLQLPNGYIYIYLLKKRYDGTKAGYNNVNGHYNDNLPTKSDWGIAFKGIGSDEFVNWLKGTDKLDGVPATTPNVVWVCDCVGTIVGIIIIIGNKGGGGCDGLKLGTIIFGTVGGMTMVFCTEDKVEGGNIETRPVKPGGGILRSIDSLVATCWILYPTRVDIFIVWALCILRAALALIKASSASGSFSADVWSPFKSLDGKKQVYYVIII